MPIPYTIQSPRLIIRCYQPSDAALLKTAVDESLEHLLPWMPWAKFEPTSLAEKVQRLRLMRGQFDLDQDYTYGIFNREENRVLGGCGLHKRRGPRALEIGYWIHSQEIGKGYATEVAAALIKAGFDCHPIDWIEIRCDPANLASQAVPKKLGFRHEATLKARDQDTAGQPRDSMVWSLFRKDYLASDLSKQALSFKAADHSLITR